MKNPIRVAVTGGAGQIGYSLLFRIGNGEVFGSDQPVILSILEVPVPEVMKALEGVVMELEDCAQPMLVGIEASDDPNVAFKNANWVLLVGSKPRGPGMERSDLLSENGKIFVGQGKALNDHAASDVRILVVGNPCNTNALVGKANSPDIPSDRWFAMTRLDENRARSMLAGKAGVLGAEVTNLAVWGNHSPTMYPDFENTLIKGKIATDVIKDREWLENEFVPKVGKRGAAIIAARGKSSAASAANAALDTARSLITPTAKGDWFSAAVFSAGNPYGVDENLMFSFPLRADGKGNWEIVEGVSLSDYAKGKLKNTEKELLEERDAVLAMIG